MQNGRPGNDVASLRVKLDALIKRKAPKPVIDAARKKLKRMYGGTRIMKGETAFAMGVMNRGRELMVFDWDKAARMIKERKPIRAGAGLHDKWENTGGEIFVNGKVVKNVYTYLASTWAIPELALAFEDGSQEIVDCYKMQSEVPKWGATTKWPTSALVILVGKK